MRFVSLSLVVLVAACRTVPPPPNERPAPKALVAPALRLPDGIAPTGYALNLTVVPGEQTFGGDAMIEIEASRPIEVLWLNATGLSFTEAQFIGGGKTVQATTEIHGDNFVAVVPAEPLLAGKYTVRLNYSALLSRTEVIGMFQLDDDKQSYVVTQFEPLGARRAFPCFDEPQFKVPWKVSLAVKAEHLAFSNSPIESESKLGAGIKLVNFKPTPPLPTYLVAIAVGPFEIVDAGTAGGKKTPLQIITPQGRAAQAKFAAAQSGKILDALEAWFGMPYPYEKLDLLAFPIRYGAMEHPGLVTFGYQLLLARPEEDTSPRQRDFHLTAAHELAHMWFGDWVTMKWWDDLWLNESFAEWLMWKISAGLHPEWNLQVDQVRELAQALEADSLGSARKIRQPITGNDDIVGAFDDITYAKGSSVLNHFETWLTPEIFQKGVREHLAAHPFGSATSDEFLAALSRAAGRDVAAPFKTFLDQTGAPKVTVTLDCPAGQPVSAKLTQGRNLPVGSKADTSPRWQVPVCVRWGGKSEGHACTLLTGDEAALELTGAKACPTWVLPNDGFHGYYESTVIMTRGASGVGAVQTALEAKQVSRAERVGLLGSLGALATSGQIDLGDALAVVPVAMKLEQPEVWEQAAQLSRSINNSLVTDAQRPRYEAWLQKNFGARAKKLGLKVGATDDEATRVVRPQLLTLMGTLGRDAALQTDAPKLAAAWLTNRKAIHADLVSTVLTLAADGPDPTVHDLLLTAAKDEKDQPTRAKLLRALSNTSDPSRLAAHFELVRQQSLDLRETSVLLLGAANDPRTRETAWKFLEENFDGLVRRLPSEWVQNFTHLGSGFCDEKDRKKVEAFFGPRASGYIGMQHELAQTLEQIELCIALKARQEASVAKLLR